MKIVNSPCFNCVNYISGRYCLAFIRKKIPTKIFLGEKKHDEKVENQSGNYVFKNVKLNIKASKAVEEDL